MLSQKCLRLYLVFFCKADVGRQMFCHLNDTICKQGLKHSLCLRFKGNPHVQMFTCKFTCAVIAFAGNAPETPDYILFVAEL